MKSIKLETQTLEVLNPRFIRRPGLAATAGRRAAGLSLLALFLGLFARTSQATLLVYEPFEYYSGPTNFTLKGQSFGADAVGLVGTWTVGGNGTGVFASTNDAVGGNIQAIATGLNPGPFWKGTCLSIPQKGTYAGSAAWPGFGGQNGNNPNSMWASHLLDPNIATNFTLGSTNWMSCVTAQNFNANNNYSGLTFCLGSGIQNGLDTSIASARGTGVVGGPAVGIGVASSGWGSASPKYMIPGVWDNLLADGKTYQEEINTGSTGIQMVIPGQTPPTWICIARIVWGDLSTPTTVTAAFFKDGTQLTPAAFDNYVSTNVNATVVSTYNMDPTTFTNISLGGGRWDVDELRIGTTFNDVIGIVPGSPGVYWAPTYQGGSGTWAAGSTNWAQIPYHDGTLPQAPTNTLFFAGTGGTVTVNGTVTVGAGLTFSVDGYSLVPGTSTPQISLAGADAGANTITVTAGTNTIGVQVTGTTGMTKAGLKSLILGNTGNTYGGGTLLNSGPLQIAALGSLGSGNVTFGGGTLQYPPGSGTSSLDVSGVIAPVASGQVASIDPNGNSVTFNTGLSGQGGLALVGTGSLTLAGANTYTGPTTVGSNTTLNVSSASGTIATLNVPPGATLNLGAGAVVTALNITGGKVNLTGAGAQVGTLFVQSGSITNPSLHALTVTNSANLLGSSLALNGAGSFTLNGADLLNPTSTSHLQVAATGGVLSFSGAGLDVAIGQGAPGVPASPATAVFSGNGVWALNNGVATDNNNVYGKDNHAFHYIQLPTGDFDIKCEVTSAVRATVGLMARDNLQSCWETLKGNYIGTWTAMGTSVTIGHATTNTASSHASPPWVNSVGLNTAPTVVTWLEIVRQGNLITCNYSPDGVTWTQSQQVDYSTSPWGPTTYLGLDLINTDTSGGNGTFANVNFMGSAGIVNLLTTDFALTGGAQLDLGPVVYVSSISTNGTALNSGCWAGSALTGANHIDPVDFTSTATGIAVIPPAIAPDPLAPATTPADIIVNVTNQTSTVVTFATPAFTGGTAPVNVTCTPPSGSTFFAGTNLVTCRASDSTCPSGNNAYAYFHVIVNYIVPPPSPPVMLNAWQSYGGQAVFQFTTESGAYYRVLSTTNLALPLAQWKPLVQGLNDPYQSDTNGWVNAQGTQMLLYDDGTPWAGVPAKFYLIEGNGVPTAP